MKTITLALLLALTSTLGFAQKTNLDSLKNALKTAQTDSARFSLNNKILRLYMETKKDTALLYINQNLAIAQKNGKTLDVASVLDAKGYALIGFGKLSESLQCFMEGVKIAKDPKSETKTWIQDKKLTPQKRRLNVLASLHLSWGHLVGINDIKQQLFHYNQTKKIAEETGNTSLLGLVNMNMGGVYFYKLQKPDSALIMLQNAERTFIKSGNKRYLGLVYWNIGDIYLAKGNKTLAVQYFHKAIQTGAEQNNIRVVSQVYGHLSRFYLKEQQKDSCLIYAKKCLASWQLMGVKELGEAYNLLYKSYQLNNNRDSAYKYMELALVAQDSSYNEKLEELTDFQKQNFNEQLRLKALEDEKTASANRIQTYSLLAGLGVFLLLALILYRNNCQKQKANAVLENTLQKLKSTQAQLIQSEKLASLGELTAGIAHEIQNPLNFVNNFSEMSVELIEELKSPLTPDGRILDGQKMDMDLFDDVVQNLGKINFHGKRASSIVSGMLEHSKASTGEWALTDINKLADEYLRLSYHGLRAKDKDFNADFTTNFDENLPKIEVIPQDMGRVLLNLINNAFYAVWQRNIVETGHALSLPTKYQPIVKIFTQQHDNQIIITVQDNGTGMSKEVQEKIFQPFFTTKPTGQGTGLGLSLAYDIVTKGHGGTLEVISKEGVGSEFIVKLPFKV